MNWIYFPLYALLTNTLWIVGVILLLVAYDKNRNIKVLGNAALALSICVLGLFLVMLWINLERPPMRTYGETRLWNSFFILIIGYLIYLRWGYVWMLVIILFLSDIFLALNLLKPEAHEKTLMPALRSPWFVPHVLTYMVSYSILFVSAIVAAVGLVRIYSKRQLEKLIVLSDNLVYIGFSLLTLGLLFGALWAKEVWGNYWTWDPKETWAFLTWLSYLIYIHHRYFHPSKVKTQFWCLSLLIFILLIAYFGINYLPSAQNSVHVYAQ